LVPHPFDPSDPAFVADPYPTYARMRADAPVMWWEERGLHLVSRYADVNALLRDRRLGRVFVPREPRDRFAPWNFVNETALLEMEPPDHTRLRQLVAKEFTPRRVEGLRARVAAITDALLDEALAHGEEVDIVTALAEPLPVAVIAELLGIPEADRPLLRPWSNAIVALYEPAPAPGVEDAAIAASREFTAYLRDLIDRRRSEPLDDLLSALAVDSATGDRLTTDELVGTAILLLNAGHEASVNVLSNGFAALLCHPDELLRVQHDRSLIGPCAEEFIRFDTPLSLFERTAFEPVEVQGTVVAEGERVGLLLGSANRDDEVFVDPDRFDAGRRDNHHVGFGAGIHFCLGAPLARLEVQVAVDRVIDRFRSIELAGDPARRPSYQFRGHSRVPVRLRR
jgi:cytochrome P450